MVSDKHAAHLAQLPHYLPPHEFCCRNCKTFQQRQVITSFFRLLDVFFFGKRSKTFIILLLLFSRFFRNSSGYTKCYWCSRNYVLLNICKGFVLYSFYFLFSAIIGWDLRRQFIGFICQMPSLSSHLHTIGHVRNPWPLLLSAFTSSIIRGSGWEQRQRGAFYPPIKGHLGR